MKKATMGGIAALLIACAATAPAAQASGKSDASPVAVPATKQVPNTCQGARRAVRFLAIRYKKINKRARFNPSLRGKVNQAYRDYKHAIRIKNRICSSGGGGGGGGTQQALALTSSEVYNRVLAVAYAEYLADDYAIGYGAEDTSSCSSRSTYNWVCYGYTQQAGGYPYYGATCFFRESVSRVGLNGITSVRDTSYGTGGWACV